MTAAGTLALAEPSAGAEEKTLDLGHLAHLRRGEQVRVQPIADRFEALFARTVRLLPAGPSAHGGAARPSVVRMPDRGRAGSRVPRLGVALPSDPRWSGFVPGDKELRERYLLAEAVGGYEALHDLLNVYSPGVSLTRKYARAVAESALDESHVRALEEHQGQIRAALERAHRYLETQSLERFSPGEIRELRNLLALAAERDQEITRILGTHLIHEVETAVHRLNSIRLQINSVEQSVSGIFLVQSEVMFIPPGELIRMVNAIFRAVGNPYLAERIDGVLLLAARNLLIQVVAFFSYYGKHQIYNLFHRGGSSAAITAVTFRIRSEIRHLFEACKRDNRLVLTRVMQDTERDFELSVEAIQREAERDAVEAVRRIMPAPPPAPVAPRRGWLRRLVGRLKGGRS